MKMLWLDIETTGFSQTNDRIVEIAIIYDNGTDATTFRRYVKHETYPAYYDKVVAVHGITKELLDEKGIEEKRMYNDLLYFLDLHVDKYDPGDKYILCGYNVSFDDRFLRELFKRYGNKFYGSYFLNDMLDILSMAGILRVEDKYSPSSNLKLESVARDFGIDFKAHDAMEDIRATRELYSKMIKLLKN